MKFIYVGGSSAAQELASANVSQSNISPSGVVSVVVNLSGSVSSQSSISSSGVASSGVAGAINITGSLSRQTNRSPTGAVSLIGDTSAPTKTGTWTQVAVEGGSHTFTSPTLARYGANTSFFYKWVNGVVPFTNEFWGGDPIPNVAKTGSFFTVDANQITILLTGEFDLQDNLSPTGVVTSPAASSSHTLTVAASTQTNASQSLSVTQSGMLTGAATSQSATSGTGAVVDPLSGVRTLTGTNDTQLNVSGTGAASSTGAGVTKNLTGLSCTQAQTSGAGSVGATVINDPAVITNYAAWLKSDNAIRCVLMEVVAQVNGVETTRYLSNRGYTTKPTDSPANQSYQPLIAGGVQFNESISLDGTVSISYGDIEFYNIAGEIDSWMTDVWTNRTVRIYIGDARWIRSDFRLVFDGVVFGVDSRSRDRINIKLSDKLTRLNTPVIETKLGGTTPNKDLIIPLCFGECSNISPLLIDPATHEYQVHNGPIERIIEVRDNGVPVSFTANISTGKFTLNQNPAGAITCSVQGDKPAATYFTKIGEIIERLVTGYGNATTRFSSTDIDLPKLATFNTNITAPVGIYLKDRANVLEVCNSLAATVGARVTMSRAGLLSLVTLTVPRADAGTAVSALNMAERSISVSNLPPVIAAVKIGFNKNWTVQTNLQTGIPVEHAALFAQEWLTSTLINSATATKYKVFVEPAMQETYFCRGVDASAEANRRLTMYGTQRKVIQYQGMPDLLLEELGNTQTITHSRFGLSGGVAGQIVSLKTDWLKPSVMVEVLV